MRSSGLCRYTLAARRARRAVRLAPLVGVRARPTARRRVGRSRARAGPPEPADVDAFLREQGTRALAAVDQLRESDDPAAALCEILDGAAPAAFGLDARVEPHTHAAIGARRPGAPPVRSPDRSRASPEPATPAELVAALESSSVRLGDDRPSGRVRVVGLRRARTHRVSIVIVLGLEAGRLPRRPRPDALLGDSLRRSLAGRGLPARPRRTWRPQTATCCTPRSRARGRQAMLVRRAVDDNGRPREASPFWTDVREALGDGCPPVERIGLRDLTHAARRRALRPRASPRARLARRQRTRSRRAGSRRPSPAGRAASLGRAGAFARVTRIDDPAVLAEFAARRTFGASELETFTDCSQRWFVDRMLRPREVDRSVDARLAGSAMHNAALKRFFERLPAELGTDGVVPEQLETAQVLLARAVDDAVDALSLPPGSLAVVGAAPRAAPSARVLPAQRGRAAAPLPAALPGAELRPARSRRLLGDRPDRPDRRRSDSARGLIHDYKSTNAESAEEIRATAGSSCRCTCSRCATGSGSSRWVASIAASRRGRRAGSCASPSATASRASQRSDYLDEDAFWAIVAEAVETAQAAVARIRRGDVRHDPPEHQCPSWCDAHPICRVARA